MLKSGFFFYDHNYYIISFVPMLALLAGYGLTFIKYQALYIPILALCISESIMNQYHDFFLSDREKYKLNFLLWQIKFLMSMIKLLLMVMIILK